MVGDVLVTASKKQFRVVESQLVVEGQDSEVFEKLEGSGATVGAFVSVLLRGTGFVGTIRFKRLE
jgi:hypothetical protein